MSEKFVLIKKPVKAVETEKKQHVTKLDCFSASDFKTLFIKIFIKIPIINILSDNRIFCGVQNFTGQII